MTDLRTSSSSSTRPSSALRCFCSSPLPSGSAPPNPSPADLAEMLRSDPQLCKRIAEIMDPRTAAHCAASFSQLAGAEADRIRNGDTDRSGNVATFGGADEERSEKPTAWQMWQLFVRTAVPFVGFGFFDNTIMLTAGGAIDETLGVAFGFSTLAAAGLGQMVSDASGITLQGLIERFADRLGLPDPRLTLAQQQLSMVRSTMVVARILGIVFGCALGMFPLLLMPERTPRLVDQITEQLTSQERHEFTRLVTTKTLHQGDKVLEWGQQSKFVYMIQSGHLDVIGRDIDGVPFMVCTLGPGHSFGVPALHAPSHVDLVAKDEGVIVQAIDKEDFVRLTGAAAMEVFENARSREHMVYLQAQGKPGQGLFRVEAQKGSGKTRLFASLSQTEKLEVLSYTGLEEAKKFSAMRGEGKVGFFAMLSEEQKRDALLKFFEARKGSTS